MNKFSISVWPKALAAGADLRIYARVIRIETGRHGRATGAVYLDRAAGKCRFQAAAVVVLAANGVGTPRLLLASDNLAISSGQVGRNLLHHTLVSADIWVEEPLASHMGYVASVISRQFAERDLSRGFVNGFNFNCLTSGVWPADASRWFPRRWIIAPERKRRRLLSESLHVTAPRPNWTTSAELRTAGLDNDL